MNPVNDNEEVVLEETARLMFGAVLVTLADVLPDDDGDRTLISEPQAHGAMLGLVAAACQWHVQSSEACGKPLDFAKRELLAAIEDHWGQAVIASLTRGKAPN